MSLGLLVAKAALATRFLSDFGFNRIVLERQRRRASGGAPAQGGGQETLQTSTAPGLHPLLGRHPSLADALQTIGKAI